MSRYIRLEDSWKTRLQGEFSRPYMQSLRGFLQAELKAGKHIYPKPCQYFGALNQTPFTQVKVVILGQDPYHGEGQAHGLSFSVPVGVEVPPSLKNIYKELQHDMGVSMPNHGCLASWARQGVLLLNSVLTVEQGKAGSHQNKGWELFTDAIIALLNADRSNLVFMLWGSYAQRKGACIDEDRHLVLRSVHPSPLSAHRGFFGQHHFSQANAYLERHGQEPVDWLLPGVRQAEKIFFETEQRNQAIYQA